MRVCLKRLAVLGAFLLFESLVFADDLVFIHHSVGQDWLDRGLRDALEGKSYIGAVQEITYGTELAPAPGRPPSLGSVPGDSTDMQHWMFWFNDYLATITHYTPPPGFNRIVMFKSCFPNSDISSSGTEPGDPFSDEKTLANYRAVYRHPNGPGATYQFEGRNYQALEDIFATHGDILFVPVTAPPLCWGESSDANAHRARVFNDWLRNDWLVSYDASHPGLHNVAVFNLFDLLAYPDNHASHPNRLRQEYGGNSGDSHPNETGDAILTQAFATGPSNFIDAAWTAFNGGTACLYSIQPAAADFDAAGGSGTITVSSPSGCAWTAQPDDTWVSVASGSTGSGNGVVEYDVAANTDPEARTGTLTVAGQTFTVRQAAAQAAFDTCLVFPAFFKGVQDRFSNSFVGVAVSNPNDTENSLTARGLSEEGVVVGQTALTPIPAYGQKAFLASEAIDPPGTTRTLVIQGDSSAVRGFFMIGENSLNRLDGVGCEWVQAKTLYFPLAKRSSDAETTIYLHNANDTGATAICSWVGPDGKTSASTSISLSALGSAMRTLGQLFPASSVLLDGYLKVTSDENLTGCLVQAEDETYIALPAVTATPVNRLLAPHFYVPRQGGGTELRLINTQTSTASVRVRAYKDGHQLLGDETHDLGAGAIWVADLGTLMHLPTQSLGEAEAYTGYLDLEIKTGPLGQAAPVVGSIVFSGNGRRFAAALPLIGQGYRETLFPHVAQSAAFSVFTGLAVLNPGVEPANVTVVALNPAGEETGLQNFSLQPGERAVDLLNGAVFFGPEFSQDGGYLRLYSDQPLVSFALFGESTLAYMAAIGGQKMQE